MTTKQKMSKSEREEREAELADTIFYALATPIEEHSVAWARRAHKLMEGLSQASIKRAQQRANKLAEDVPPGFVKATEAMDAFEAVVRRHRITKRDEEIIWGAVSQISMFQLGARRGTFYEAARDFRLVMPHLRDLVVRVSPGDIAAKCDCPNCRPRAAEELN